MAMNWKATKGYQPVKGGKQGTDKFLEYEQLERLLKAVEEGPSKHKKRDWMLLYCGFVLGLRVSECVALSRATFRNVREGPEEGWPLIGRLKKASKIPCQCSACGRKWNAKLSRAGTTMKCASPSCDQMVRVIKPVGKRITEGPQEVELRAFHPTSRKKILDYLKEMPEDQFYLFPGKRDPKTGRRTHMAASHAAAIFNRYVLLAGLNPKLSWHSLRHGLGSLIFEKTDGNLVAIKEALGHSSVKTAEIYGHLTGNANRKVIESLGTVFDK